MTEPTLDLETRTNALARKRTSVPAEASIVAGYDANKDVIPLGIDLNFPIRVSPSTSLAQATVAIMDHLVERFGSAPDGYSPEASEFLGYSALINDGLNKGMSLGVGNRYTWGFSLPPRLSRTDESGRYRDCAHVTIVEHPQHKGVFLYQVVEQGVNPAPDGRRGTPYKRLFEAGAYKQETDTSSLTISAESQNGIVKR